MVEAWNIHEKLKVIANDDTKEICKAIKLFYGEHVQAQHINSALKHVHIQCLAQVINVAVKDVLTVLHPEINNIRKLIGAIRVRVNRRDLYEKN